MGESRPGRGCLAAAVVLVTVVLGAAALLVVVVASFLGQTAESSGVWSRQACTPGAATPAPAPSGPVPSIVPVAASSPEPAPADPQGDPFAGLDDEQATNVRTIVGVGTQRGEPAAAKVVALATARQESGWRNLPYGDSDSLGLFQQRPSQGWGTPEQILDPVYAAGKFYDALDRVPGWQQMPVTVAAQAVQRSKYPDAYAPWVEISTRLVTAAGGGVTVAAQCTPGVEQVSSTQTGPVVLPIDPGHYRLTAGFGQAGSRWSHRHTGLDFAAPVGTPIHAVMAGTVLAAARCTHGCAYGNLTEIDHGGGLHTWYAHQSAFLVHPGDHVTAGQVIGRVGATGNVTGPHVHLEVRIGGTPVDPRAWLTQKGLNP
jgi:murein DD-endopeptidase MepM/ murein hydrolase activator NlpD